MSGPEPPPFGTSPDLPADTAVAPCPSGNKTTRPSHLLKRALREFPSAGQGALPQGRVRAIFPVRHAHVSGLEATLDPPRIDRRQHRRCSMPQRQLKHKAFTPRKWGPYKQSFPIRPATLLAQICNHIRLDGQFFPWRHATEPAATLLAQSLLQHYWPRACCNIFGPEPAATFLAQSQLESQARFPATAPPYSVP